MITYQVASSFDPSQLSEKIEQLSQQGFYLHGSLVVVYKGSGAFYSQAMAKEVSRDTVKRSG